MRIVPLSCLALLLCRLSAATDVRVDFTLATTDDTGAAITEARNYYVYRPDTLPRSTPVPMVLVMQGGAATFLHHQADVSGFLVVSCTFTGNSLGSVWNNDNPRITGFEDYDYVSAVIARVAAAENARDAFICGLSKGGHMAYAFACERPREIKAACSVDEFMGLTSNLPQAPVPILALHGTLDTNVPYTMGKDSVDAWRAMDGLLGVTPVTTYEASPLQPGQVTQTTWRRDGLQVAFVTIIGGDHRWPVSTVQTGYDSPAALWAFFSQFLTPTQAAPRIVAPPVDQTQIVGLPASFHVSAIATAPVQLQWQRNGTDIPGATNDSYTVPAVTSADSGAVFRAVATTSAGTATSTAATLTVNAAPANLVVTTAPADQTVVAGQPVTFTCAATGTGTLQYQWRKNGMTLAGATQATYSPGAALSSDCGAGFSVVVTNGTASVTSRAATLTVLPAPNGPIILANPERSRVLVGDTATFAVSAWSPTPLRYQWQKGPFLGVMTDIPGATSATYTTPAAALEDNHLLFRCVVANAAGSATSASEMLFVTTARTPPTDITSPVTAYAEPGGPIAYRITTSSGTVPVTFSASPLPPGVSLDAATGVLSGSVAQPGVYRFTLAASNAAGSTSAGLTLTVASTPVNWTGDRLANLATRAQVGPGEQNLIAGFAIRGSAGKRVLLRAVGPGLAKFGVAGTLTDPRLTLLDAQGRTVATSDDWDARSGVAAAGDSVGAFALDPGSKDAALLVTLTAGNYTARLDAPATASRGIALVEVYDLDGATTDSQLINLSTRGLVGGDTNAMIAGLVISGAVPKPVLIRAIGAAALSTFGVSGGLGDVALEVYDAAGQLVARNDDWTWSTLAPFLPQACRSAGAFALSAPSKDAAVLAVLAPGAYTAKVINRDQPDAVALVEVYQAPAPP